MAADLYPLRAKQVVIESSEAFPSVVAAVGASHEILQHQPYVDEADVVIRWKVALQKKKFTVRTASHKLGLCHHPSSSLAVTITTIFSLLPYDAWG